MVVYDDMDSYQVMGIYSTRELAEHKILKLISENPDMPAGTLYWVDMELDK